MGTMSRLLLHLRVRTSSVMDQAEDPRQVLDYAYNQQLELLAALKRGLVEVATAKHQLKQQVAAIGLRAPRLEAQAARALEQGREDLARQLLQRKHSALAELEGLTRQLQEVTEEEGRLIGAQQKMSARVEEFRSHRAVVAARYTAASASVRAGEAVSGVAGEMAELGMAVGRAEEKAERMLSRATALESLLADSSLEVGFGDGIEQELTRLESAAAVELELGELKLLTSGREANS